MSVAGQKRQATEFMKMISNEYKVYELKGRMYYPALINPKTQDDGYQEFVVDITFDVHENAQVVAAVNGLVQQALKRFYPTVPDALIRLPVVDNRIARYDGKQHAAWKEGKFSVKAHTKAERVPKIIVADNTDPRGYRDFSPMDAQKIYNGADCWLSFKMGALENASGKFGATVYLNGICLLGTGEKVEMRSGDSVEDIFSGFLNKTSGGNQNAQQNYNPNQGQGQQNNGQGNYQQNNNYQNSQGQQNYQQNNGGYNPNQGQQNNYGGQGNGQQYQDAQQANTQHQGNGQGNYGGQNAQPNAYPSNNPNQGNNYQQNNGGYNQGGNGNSLV